MRPGAAYFLQPDSSQQRRYEALRAYFVEDLPASQVADRYGYSTASVHQMATLLRAGKLQLFAHTKPGPKGPRKATGELRTKILALRAADHSVTARAAFPVTASVAANPPRHHTARCLLPFSPKRRSPAPSTTG